MFQLCEEQVKIASSEHLYKWCLLTREFWLQLGWFHLNKCPPPGLPKLGHPGFEEGLVAHRQDPRYGAVPRLGLGLAEKWE